MSKSQQQVKAKSSLETPPAGGAVHPLAQRVANILSPMSLRDQKMCSQRLHQILYGAGIVLYPIAWYMQRFTIFAVGMLAAGAVCVILFIPNWYQNRDPEVEHVPVARTAAYYQRLEALRRGDDGVDAAVTDEAK